MFSGSGRVSLFLAAALAYGRLGWEKFPIREGTKDRPHLKEWGVWATSNPDQISKWWTAWPRDNIGLACGPSQIAVVDVDTKEGKNGQRTIDRSSSKACACLRRALADAERRPTVSLSWRDREHVAKIGAHLYDQPYTSHVEPGAPVPTTAGNPAAPKPHDRQSAKAYACRRLSLDQPGSAGAGRCLGRRGLRQETAARRTLTEPVIELDQAGNIKWAIDYLQNDAPPAIEGSGGEFTTLKVAMVLRGYGISEDQDARIDARALQCRRQVRPAVGCRRQGWSRPESRECVLVRES